MQKGFVLRAAKKIAAIGVGAAMLGATLTGALALDLKDYPSPFVKAGVYDASNALVTGANALAADTLGAVDIASNLQFESKTKTTGAATTVTVTGGKSEKVALGKDLTASTYFDETMQDDDLSNLQDTTITFQGTEYDVEDELNMTRGVTGPYIATSLTSSETDYKNSVHLEVPNTKTVRYCYKFSESCNISTATTSRPLEIKYMGRTIKIYTVTSNTKMSVFVGEEHYILAGSSVTVEGKTITVSNVGASSAVVDVDGVSATIATGAEQTLNGLEVYIKDVVQRTELAESAATVVVGKDSIETYDDNSAFIDEDKDDPNWRWDLVNLLGTNPHICVDNDFSYNDLDDKPPGVGECLDLPLGFLSVCLDSLSVADTDYTDYTCEYKSSIDVSDAHDAFGGSSEKGVYCHTTQSEGFEMQPFSVGANVSSTKKTREFWVLGNGNGSVGVYQVYYYDNDLKNEYLYGYINMTAATASPKTIAYVTYGNTKSTNVVVQLYNASAARLGMQFDILGDESTDLGNNTDDIRFFWGLSSGEINSLGDTAGGATAEGSELNVQMGNDSGVPSWKDIGTYDEDHRSKYGIIIKNPDSQGSNDAVALSMPNDEVFANVVIKGKSAVVSAGGESYTPAAISVKTLLDTEVTDPTMYNLILVGGPCANPLVTTVFGMTCEGWTYSEGEGIVKLAANGDKVAMLVAGTNAMDTRRAAKAIANYKTYKFSGAEALVKGTTLSDITVSTA